MGSKCRPFTWKFLHVKGLHLLPIHRVASRANPTEMVGDLEILATFRTLQQQIHVVVGESTLKYREEFPELNTLMVNYTNLVDDIGHYDALVLHTRFSCTKLTTLKVSKRRQQQRMRNEESDQKDDSDNDPWYCVLCDEERQVTMVRC